MNDTNLLENSIVDPLNKNLSDADVDTGKITP